jgi:hypothetical protein
MEKPNRQLRVFLPGIPSLLIGLDLPSKLDPAKDTMFHLTATNLNGRKTPTSVTVSIQRLHQPDRFFVQRSWPKPDLTVMTEKEFHSDFPNISYKDEDHPEKWDVEKDILKKEYNTGIDSLFSLSGIEHRASSIEDRRQKTEGGKQKTEGLGPGTFRLTLRAVDPFGVAIEQTSTFVVYDPTSATVPVPEIDEFVPVKTSGEPGEKAKFLIGSKAENVNVLYEVRVHDSLYSRQWLKLSNNQKQVEIPILEKFRGNFSVNFIFIRYDRSYQHSEVVTVPYTNKHLDIKFETFRDKLYPGQEEEWKIRISDGSKKGVRAEYLTSMYDASLDVFAPNTWSFSVLRDYYSSLPWEINGGFHLSSGLYYPLQPGGGEYFFPAYEELNWFGFGIGGGGRFRGMRGSVSMDEMAKEVAPMSVDQGMSETKATPQVETNATLDKTAISAKEPPKPQKQEGVQIRRDFRETAFFYPSLVTDSAGNLDMKFTLPESLTKWKILGFAYSKDLKYGQIEKEVITHKDLMVFPNSPRFVRQGDTLIFSAKLVNLSDRALDGDVGLELTNSLTQKPVDLIISGQRQHFTIPTGQSSAFSWKITIPDDPSLTVLQYRITARSGNFSDGEEKAFPVLPNRMLVTESLPLPVRGTGSVDFKFDKLLNSGSDKTLKNFKLTLEFASNPAWYAVQALPTMDDPRFPNADNIFRSWYTNSIAMFIANSNPAIKKVFENWMSLPNDALVSNLMKNEQLKSALLQETPWVMEAQDETQRKHRLSLFFDLNNMKSRLDGNLLKLQKMQTPSGGWPWFDGMPENRYITQDIVTGLGHLDHLGIKKIQEDKGIWNMVSKAVNYLDNELLKDYKNLKKYYPATMDENHLGATEIQYLYARSYFLSRIPLPAKGDLNTAYQYFRQQAEKYWLQNDLYGQGMIALALNRMGNKDVPTAILKSLSEKALHSPEMGMYWATQGGYEWYQAPIETQAMLIEAFSEVGGRNTENGERKSEDGGLKSGVDTNSPARQLASSPAAVEEMKVWLLKQKQTQDWKTGHATAEACYALLLRGTDLLSEQPEVKIGLGNETIDPLKLTDTKVEAGTEYFQVYKNGSEVKPEMGNVKVTKSNEGVAWGAVYWQYFQDLDKITPHASPLKVEKKLFIERVTPTGKQLEPIEHRASSIEHLKVGDKIIVRIISNR